MDSIVTLVCHRDRPTLQDDVIADAASTFLAKPVVLSEGIAIEFPVPVPFGADLVGKAEAFKTTYDEIGLDVVAQPAENREKKLLIADMDSTIIQQECLDELAAFAGRKDEISAITERAMRGELDFEEALKERVSMLRGLPVSTLNETLETCIKLTPGAVALVQTMNARGAMTALVSGGFTFFTHRIAQALGFQENQGNVLGVEDGQLTGELEGPIFGREAKQEALERICEFEGIRPAETLAVGDGANDLAMLKSAGTGVAFHAKPIVAEAAKVRIDHADLTALLYLQGIPQSEFVTA